MAKTEGSGPELETVSLVHMQAERMAQSRFIDLMAGAGVGYNQIAKEVLFFLPKDFLDIYAEVWHEGVAGKDDGGTGQRGQSQAEVGRLGKAATKNTPGKIQISSGGAKRKGYKKYWVIADEEALELKDRLDKRLRALARDARLELRDIRSRRDDGSGRGSKRNNLQPDSSGHEASDVSSEGRSGGRSSGQSMAGKAEARERCKGCGRLIGSSWKFCSNCGQECSHE